MAKDKIHPQYYPKAKIACVCGAKFETGSTKPEIKVEICSRCHPFYTGKQQFIDAAGRVEKFEARRKKSVKRSTAAQRVPARLASQGEAGGSANVKRNAPRRRLT